MNEDTLRAVYSPQVSRAKNTRCETSHFSAICGSLERVGYERKSGAAFTLLATWLGWSPPYLYHLYVGVHLLSTSERRWSRRLPVHFTTVYARGSFIMVVGEWLGSISIDASSEYTESSRASRGHVRAVVADTCKRRLRVPAAFDEKRDWE
ncbi:hypothetical protein RRG08_066677 [Elysia crispata]|uniref:Uncharacterized protein n=1 Tax=Elysia crispata TaxID=231223 RepID=A0AAE1DQZ0_9GAST|nr:hypothetical protein RRG08_066677 [Elysia crispata]